MASLGDISSSLVTKTCSFCSWHFWWEMRQYVPNLRTHQKTGHHRVLFGLRDCHIWQPMLLVTLKILGFVFPTSPLLAFVEIKFQTTEQEGCRNLFRGPFCLPFFSRLTHHVNCYTVTTDSSCSFGTGLFWAVLVFGQAFFLLPVDGPFVCWGFFLPSCGEQLTGGVLSL